MNARVLTVGLVLLLVGALAGLLLRHFSPALTGEADRADSGFSGAATARPDWAAPVEVVGEASADGGPRPDRAGLNHPARPNEAVFLFRDEAVYRKFLAEAGDYGLKVLSTLPSLRGVRLGTADHDGLMRALAGLGDAILSEPNLLIGYPAIPASTATASGLELPFKNHFLAVLGLENRSLSWGEGVTVAVLDSGVQPHLTLGGEVAQAADYLPDDGEINGHGTAVASLIAGTHPLAPGVAPGAEIRSYRVLGSDGVGDMFTVAEGIVQAVDDGADVINLSLGAYGESEVVARALDYAAAAGVAVVASAGNDGIPLVAFPASYPSVIAVGAVDARQQQVWFSNEGEGIDLVAPGYGLYAAYPDDRLVQISGTSFSGPVVAGMIAGVLSENPGLNGTEAAALVTQYTHDAGWAGPDSSYGAGIPNYDRIAMQDTPGILNAGVSGVALRSTAEGASLHTAVQNRGTQTLFNIAVEVRVGSNQTMHVIPRLDPGQSGGFDWALPAQPGDTIEVRAAVRSGGGDVEPADNEVLLRLAVPE